MSASLSTFAIPPSIFRPQKLEVTVRYAIPSDIPSIADVVAQSMLDDELFKYVCPGRRQYYGSFRNAFLRRVKEGFVIPGWCLIVAVARTAVGGERGEERGGKEVVLGYCAWERRGDDKHAEEWKREKKGFFWKGKEWFYLPTVLLIFILSNSHDWFTDTPLGGLFSFWRVQV